MNQSTLVELAALVSVVSLPVITGLGVWVASQLRQRSQPARIRTSHLPHPRRERAPGASPSGVRVSSEPSRVASYELDAHLARLDEIAERAISRLRRLEDQSMERRSYR